MDTKRIPAICRTKLSIDTHADLRWQRWKIAVTEQSEVLAVFYSLNVRHPGRVLGARAVPMGRPSVGGAMVVCLLAELAERPVLFQPEYEDRH